MFETKSNHIDGNFHIQQDGIALGNPLSFYLANLFIEDFLAKFDTKNSNMYDFMSLFYNSSLSIKHTFEKDKVESNIFSRCSHKKLYK